MRGDVDHHIEFFTQRVGFIDAELQIFVIEFVVLSPAGTLKNMRYAFAYGADAVYAGQPRYSLRVRNNWFKHGVLVLMTGQIRRTGCGELGSVPTLRAGIVAAQVQNGKQISHTERYPSDIYSPSPRRYNARP
jgi:hypothetical protein